MSWQTNLSTLRRQLLRYMVARVAIIASLPVVILVGSRLVPAWGGELAPGFYGQLAAWVFALTLLYSGLLRLPDRWQRLHAYLQFTVDLLLVTYLIARFEVVAPFSPFYILVIIFATFVLGQRPGLAMALAAYGLYAFMLFRIEGPASARAEVTGLFVYSLVAHLIGFIAITRLTAYLIQRVLRAEEELEVQREDLADLKVVHRDVIASIPSGISTADLDGYLTSINAAGLRILAKDDEGELIGEHIVSTELFTEASWLQLTVASAEHQRLRSEVQLERSGQRIDIGFSLSRLTDSEGQHRGYIVIFQDFTRWRKLEEEVRIKDRMAAVGELAAGIAHEIGNPLAAISGSVQLLAQAGDGLQDKERKLLAILLKESQRLDRTIKGFLRFARPKERSVVRFDIAALLSENVELLRNSPEVEAHHQVELTLDPPQASIMGDPDQISQIFWNLARNAVKAMPEGGLLSIRGERRDGWYRFLFTDTGHGMTKEERTNLFHPFKSRFDSGTGIGMAIVYRIVQEHGGHLRVDSTPGSGSTVVVELPAEGAPAMEVPA